MTSENSARGLDHLVLCVADLDRAAKLYDLLGFQVGARNRHPWGTENRIVQFPGCFLELIAVADESAIPEHGPRRFSFGAFVRDTLRQRQGLAMLVLESRDAKADAATFAAAGIGDYEPFFFERTGRRPDGSDVRVAFELAFARDALAPDCGTFVCQQLEPRNFWNPDFQKHANGAAGIPTVYMAASQPSAHDAFFTAFSGANPEPGPAYGPRAAVSGSIFRLPRGRIEVLARRYAAEGLQNPDLAKANGAAFGGFSVTVPDPSMLIEPLFKAGLRFLTRPGSLLVGPEVAFGTTIVFELPAPG